MLGVERPDRVFFWVKDADLYRTWFGAVHSPPADVAKIIRTRFQSDFVLCEARPRHLALIAQLYESPGVKVGHQVGVWALFELEDPS